MKKKKISQVILIGDAAPNTPQEVTFKRKHQASKGEEYWTKSKYADVKSADAELAQLIENKIPVHAFYINNAARAAFESISSKSGGVCKPLDINSEKGADVLADLVTQTILRALDTKLVEAYAKKFGTVAYV